MSATIPLELGVNIDHVATLRQARGTPYPDPVKAALLAEACGADAITLHLREDRRHIQDRDVEILRERLTKRMNLEAAITGEMLAFACRIRPRDVGDPAHAVSTASRASTAAACASSPSRRASVIATGPNERSASALSSCTLMLRMKSVTDSPLQARAWP